MKIREATEQDIPLILSFIRQLAEYERMSHEAVTTEAMLRESLFGTRPHAEVLLGYADDKPVGFAVFFHNFSTFLGRPGLYLEDLFVIPEMRGKGFGRASIADLVFCRRSDRRTTALRLGTGFVAQYSGRQRPDQGRRVLDAVASP